MWKNYRGHLQTGFFSSRELPKCKKNYSWLWVENFLSVEVWSPMRERFTPQKLRIFWENIKKLMYATRINFLTPEAQSHWWRGTYAKKMGQIDPGSKILFTFVYFEIVLKKGLRKARKWSVIGISGPPFAPNLHWCPHAGYLNSADASPFKNFDINFHFGRIPP